MTDAGYWDRQYNPRLSVPDAADTFANWSRWAAEARTTRPPVEISYGAHPRETLHLFRGARAHGTFVFIHGGYWRAFSKEDVSWIAPAFVDAGFTVAILGYPLCPEVSLTRIGSAIAQAMECLYSTLTPAEQRRVVIGGHSAGGHLAAGYQSSKDVRRADGIVGVSGLFDLLPLKQTQMLASLGFEVQELCEASPLFAPAPASGGVLLAVGGEEPAEFHWQSVRLAQAWQASEADILVVPGRHHFSVLEALADPAQPLFHQTLRLLC